MVECSNFSLWMKASANLNKPNVISFKELPQGQMCVNQDSRTHSADI